jgi:hypothetical protein
MRVSQGSQARVAQGELQVIGGDFALGAHGLVELPEHPACAARGMKWLQGRARRGTWRGAARP